MPAQLEPELLVGSLLAPDEVPFAGSRDGEAQTPLPRKAMIGSRALEIEGREGDSPVAGHGTVRLAPHALEALLSHDGTVGWSSGLEHE